MNKQNTSIIIFFLLFILMLSCFSSIVQSETILQKSEKKDIAPLLDPPVGVEFIRDPLPLPRRSIAFAVYSNDETLFTVNVNISYDKNGKILYKEEGTIPVRVGKPHHMSLTLFNYGIGKGIVKVRLWKHNKTHDFDWTFSSQTRGWLFFVSVL